MTFVQIESIRCWFCKMQHNPESKLSSIKLGVVRDLQSSKERMYEDKRKMSNHWVATTAVYSNRDSRNDYSCN